ncbi:MAG TPA: phosphotriesterase-related protein [Streptosporangiaceae bacterium]|nr:phosphotriesterase-related protein [Streptosporangiaceae bacterium]
MAMVETVRGQVDVSELGTTLMHEHVFVLNEEIRQNYPEDWDEEYRVAHAVAQLDKAFAGGVTTIADPTVIGLGRDIWRIKRVAERTPVNIIVATGVYTFSEVPFYFRYRSRRLTASREDPMTELFVRDITEGIAGTGVKAAFLKCAVDEPGLTRGVERVLRAVARAHVLTGAPVTVHTHPATRNGLSVIQVLREEGADLTRVVIGHSGDSKDAEYLAQVADAGCLLGMDRFGIGISPSLERRAEIIAALCGRGYAAQMVLSHDAACYIDWYPHDEAKAGNYLYIHDYVLPALIERGVSAEQIQLMLVGNPRRYFTPQSH